MAIEDPHARGLYHPKIVSALLEGQDCLIDRAEFLGPNYDIYQNDYQRYCQDFYKADYDSQTTYDKSASFNSTEPAVQWENLMPYARKTDSAQHTRNPETDSMTITPDMWLTIQGGTGPSDIAKTINTLLESRKLHPASATEWAEFPQRVTEFHLWNQSLIFIKKKGEPPEETNRRKKEIQLKENALKKQRELREIAVVHGLILVNFVDPANIGGEVP
ncbi:MAG: hypothetical protein HC848_05730 [Limnobacter sp.]|nr:hypothetical protein [Limnobacter sp.]